EPVVGPPVDERRSVALRRGRGAAGGGRGARGAARGPGAGPVGGGAGRGGGRGGARGRGGAGRARPPPARRGRERRGGPRRAGGVARPTPVGERSTPGSGPGVDASGAAPTAARASVGLGGSGADRLPETSGRGVGEGTWMPAPIVGASGEPG